MLPWHVVSVDPVPCLAEIHTSYSCWMECRCFCLQLTIWAETRMRPQLSDFSFWSSVGKTSLKRCNRWKCVERCPVRKKPQCIKNSKGRNILPCFERIQKSDWYIYLYYVFCTSPYLALGTTYHSLNVMYCGFKRRAHTNLDLLNQDQRLWLILFSTCVVKISKRTSENTWFLIGYWMLHKTSPSLQRH